MALSTYPDKQEEINHLAEFVDALPRCSYLFSIMPEVQRLVIDAIRNDLGFVPIANLIGDVVSTRKELEELRKKQTEERRKHEIETRTIELRAIRAKEELEECRQIAARLSCVR